MAIISISDSQINSADQVLVADASSKIPAKDGSQITVLNATNVASGTIATARLDTGTTANKIVVLDGSGNLPVVDGSLLTGIVSATVSASDPTVSTNPSAGLGAEWNNSTSGEMYICTDATAGANVWTNVGAGSGDVEPHQMQGTTYGYVTGTSGYADVIQRFPFAAAGNSVDVGDMSQGRSSGAGHCSATHGYVTGGNTAAPTLTLIIEKYSFATGTQNGSNIGNITEQRTYPAGSTSSTHGYTAGGNASASGTGGGVTIDRFPFATDTNSSDVGDLTVGRQHLGGQSSTTHGYCTGGYASFHNVIDKYSFSASATATDVGNLTAAKNIEAAASDVVSTASGYTMGGYNGGNNNVIEKFSFTTDGNAVDLADLTQSRRECIGSSSETHGYASGGYTSSSVNTIDRFSFSAGSNSVDHGDLLTSDYAYSATQV